MPVALAMALLVMAQPDMGTTIVLLLVMLALLFTAGAPLAGRSPGSVSAWARGSALLAITEPYRLQRLTGFRNPCAAAIAQSIGYQACQGLYALSSGGWFGLGLGGSREKFGYLPNQYTDYIFAIIGEELGLLGTLAGARACSPCSGTPGIRIAQRCSDRFSQLAAAGVTAWLLGQALVNMGAVVGLLPITGIPLPLVSFGGSALVPTMFAIGMLISFARREPGDGAGARGPQGGPHPEAGPVPTVASCYSAGVPSPTPPAVPGRRDAQGPRRSLSRERPPRRWR